MGLAEGGLTLLDQARSRLPWHIHTRPRSPLLKLTFILPPNKIAHVELNVGLDTGKRTENIRWQGPGNFDLLDEAFKEGRKPGCDIY